VSRRWVFKEVCREEHLIEEFDGVVSDSE